MRIVLVNPNPMQPPVTPVALDYIGAACDTAGIKVDLVDCSVEHDWPKKLAQVLAEQPVMVGITVRNIDDSYFASRDFILPRIIPILDEIKRLTDAPICLGGVGFSIFPVETLRFCNVSYGIRGDGESAIVKLVMALEGKIEREDVPGLVWLDNGSYRENALQPVLLAEMDLSSRALIDNV